MVELTLKPKSSGSKPWGSFPMLPLLDHTLHFGEQETAQSDLGFSADSSDRVARYM